MTTSLQKRESKIVSYYMLGMSICQIADSMSLTRSTVNNVVRKYGISRPGRKLGRDLIGQRFGKLTAVRISHVYERNGERFWLCKCDCGSEKVVRFNSLRDGHTKSCGCIRSPSKATT